MSDETLIHPRPRVRFPRGKQEYDVFLAKFKEKFPYIVHTNAVTGRLDAGDRWIALQWAEKNNLDFAWEFNTFYFAKKEEAALFKMGIWMND